MIQKRKIIKIVGHCHEDINWRWPYINNHIKDDIITAREERHKMKIRITEKGKGKMSWILHSIILYS